MKISNTSKQIIITTIALFFIVLGISTFIVDDIKSFLIGISFGTIFSILKIILLEKTIEKAIDMTGQKAINYTRIHYTLRYFLTFVVLLIAAYKNFNIIGVVLGILLPVPSVYIVNLKNKSK
ncbi:ATP synthase subunit I [uncultured Tyzzerella sp.]|uniref:ATP synthase subunit I n=1 Tax=uncultured Tyzzerella sp. TaxID=2321398 RepID=UPI002942F497|nr:ATP synthase subunit I [uncultured Tyzzerella sp.]